MPTTKFKPARRRNKNLRGKELAYAVLDQIDADPKTWNQSRWRCGTGMCFAGWAVELTGHTWARDRGDQPRARVVAGPIVDTNPQYPWDAATVASRLLGETHSPDYEYLFHGYNNRRDLKRIVKAIWGPRDA